MPTEKGSAEKGLRVNVRERELKHYAGSRIPPLHTRRSRGKPGAQLDAEARLQGRPPRGKPRGRVRRSAGLSRPIFGTEREPSRLAAR